MSEKRCGNCEHYHDSRESIFGLCRIILPPWVSEKAGQEFRKVSTLYVCDLHRRKQSEDGNDRLRRKRL